MEVDRAAWLDWGLLPQPARFGTPRRGLVGPPPAKPPEVVAAAWEGEPVKFRPGEVLGADALAAQEPPSDSIDSYDDAEVEDLFGEEEEYPFTITPHRYNPLPT